MGKITKVKDINIAKLNNAEYRTFMARYGSLIAGDGGDSESPDEISFDPNDPLGIPAELRTAFDSDFKLLTDAVNQSSASEETAQMSAIDKERDDLLTFITSTVSQMMKSPLAAQRTAAEKLYLAVKPAIRSLDRAAHQRTGRPPGGERQENPPPHGRGIRRDDHLRLRPKRGEAHSGDGHLHQPPQRADRRDQRPLQPTHSARESRRRQEASG